MPALNATKRANLPNSAFAYVDSKGHRRLPIHDEAHVRNALARFNQDCLRGRRRARASPHGGCCEQQRSTGSSRSGS